MTRSRETFWRWLLEPGETPRGLWNVVDPYLALHGVIGIGVALLAIPGLAAAASIVTFPLAGVVIGLAFAWGANAVAVMQTPEIQKLGERVPGGVEEYLRLFQLSVLIVLGVVVCWGLCGLSVPQKAVSLIMGEHVPMALRIGGRVVMYALLSLAIRTAWEVVVGTQELLKAAMTIRAEHGNGEELRT